MPSFQTPVFSPSWVKSLFFSFKSLWLQLTLHLLVGQHNASQELWELIFFTTYWSHVKLFQIRVIFNWMSWNQSVTKRAFWLANMLDPFGLHADARLFICSFSRYFFFHRCWRFLTNNSYFSSKIWKNLTILPEMMRIIPVSHQISSSRFLLGLCLTDLLI